MLVKRYLLKRCGELLLSERYIDLSPDTCECKTRIQSFQITCWWSKVNLCKKILVILLCLLVIDQLYQLWPLTSTNSRQIFYIETKEKEACSLDQNVPLILHTLLVQSSCGDHVLDNTLELRGYMVGLCLEQIDVSACNIYLLTCCQ